MLCSWLLIFNQNETGIERVRSVFFSFYRFVFFFEIEVLPTKSSGYPPPPSPRLTVMISNFYIIIGINISADKHLPKAGALKKSTLVCDFGRRTLRFVSLLTGSLVI